MAKKKQENLTLDEKLKAALVPDWEWPYKVPENWVWTRVKDVCKLNNGDKLFGSDLPYLEARYLRGKTEATYKSCGNSVEKGSKVILVDGENSGEVFNVTEKGYMGSTFKLLKIAKGVSENLFEQFISIYKDEFKNSKTGSAIPHLKKELFYGTAFPLPPLAEQKRIVDSIENLFTKIDEAKNLAKSALDSFEQRKSAILHQAFSGELTQKWRKENGVGMDSWEKVQLGDACDINPGRVDTRHFADDLLVTFVPMTAVSDVYGGIKIPLVEKLSKVKKGYTNFIEGDVIFAKITPCMENGKSAIVGRLENNIGFGSTEFHVIRCKEVVNNKFIYYLVRWQKFINEAKAVLSGAVGQQRVPKSFVEEYQINLPTRKEQTEIVRILDSIFAKEKSSKELTDIIEKIDLLKKTVLAKAFRGELGTNDSNEESAEALLQEVLNV